MPAGIAPANLKLKAGKRANSGKLLYCLKTLKNRHYLLPKKIE
jgi:hypothetical protein